MREILTADLFCGAGGTFTGFLQTAEQRGLTVKGLAINHSPAAIATHTANHPGVRHLCVDIDTVDPRKAIPEGRLDLLMASPECMHHSRALGGKPRNDQSRASGWMVLRWLEALRVERVLLENVPEWQDWGPLDDNNRPIKKYKGQTFRAYIRAMQALGYTVEYRILNCANYGDPTTRERLFVLARRGKRQRIRWPEMTHRPPGPTTPLIPDERPTWRTAREIIDWSLKGESIFKRKKPLSPNTLARIVKGLQKFSGLEIENPEAFIVALSGTSDAHVAASAHSLGLPLPTVTGSNRLYLAEPGQAFILGQQTNSVPRNVEAFIIGAGGPTGAGRPRSVEDPVGTILGTDRHGLVESFIVQMDQGGSVHSLEQPVNTLTSADARGFVQPFLVETRHGEDHNRSYSLDRPTVTITGKNGLAFVEGFTINYNGTGVAHDLADPLPTVTGSERHGLVVVLRDGRRALLDIRFRMLAQHELAAAQGFPKSYVFKGRTRKERTKQIGNAVPVNTAAALTDAALWDF